MRTKYILHTGPQKYELKDDDLSNWGDIKCSFKRESYEGVVRSFTSQFEFVNTAAAFIREAYLRDGINAEVTLSVLTMNDHWEFEERFSCPLDFSTISWTNGVVSIHSIDNSLAALIKANKSTRYELVIGEDIVPDDELYFHRIHMQEQVTYAITGGESYDDSSELYVTIPNGENPRLGVIESETSINLAVDWNDDQEEDADSYLLRATKAINMTLNYDLSWRRDLGKVFADLFIVVMRKGQQVLKQLIATPGPDVLLDYLGEFNDPGTLQTSHPSPNPKQWAVVQGIVWFAEYQGSGSEWVWTGKSREEYFLAVAQGSVPFELQEGDKVAVHAVPPVTYSAEFHLVSSRFSFCWQTVGEPVNLPVFTVETVANRLLEKVADGKAVAEVSISDYDSRLAYTRVLAAEAARAITGGKFYSTFAEFCDWMQTVFGYIHTVTKTDDGYNVHFLHRSELFSGEPKKIAECKDVTYSVDSSVIYSAVTIGYDKKDYDSINGRDEFNFNNTYSTGCSMSSKTLTLISKYRADSYGVEFAVQKRGQETTDDVSDADVFFILCKKEGKRLVVDRTVSIIGALNDDVFNGAFAPSACVEANKGFIGLQSSELTLAFASSTGNSAVVIDDVSLSSDIVIQGSFATCGVLDISTPEIVENTDANELFELTDGTLRYLGYIREADIRYARRETGKYKLIVKEVAEL